LGSIIFLSLLPDGDVITLRTDTFNALYDLAKDDDVPNYKLDVL
jgi:anaerobic glycerol-3-phosphate dehydrogenase